MERALRLGWASSRWPAVECWLRPGLALFFVAAGVAKLLGVQSEGEMFRQLGYTPWFMRLTGAVQLLAGLGLLFPASMAIAAFILAACMAGAAGSLLSNGNLWMLPAPLALLPPLLAIAWHNAPFWHPAHPGSPHRDGSEPLPDGSRLPGASPHIGACRRGAGRSGVTPAGQ